VLAQPFEQLVARYAGLPAERVERIAAERVRQLVGGNLLVRPGANPGLRDPCPLFCNCFTMLLRPPLSTPPAPAPPNRPPSPPGNMSAKLPPGAPPGLPPGAPPGLPPNNPPRNARSTDEERHVVSHLSACPVTPQRGPPSRRICRDRSYRWWLSRWVRRPYAIKVLGLLVVILGADCIASTRLGLGPAIVG
jgi:hypothetical protein